MTNYDHDVLGVGNPMHPANSEDVCEKDFDEVLYSLEYSDKAIIEDHISIIENRLRDANQRSKYMLSKLKRLAEIEQSIVIFGKLTFEEETERKEILNQYS